MKLKKHIIGLKNKTSKKLTAISATIVSLLTAGSIQTNAVVDVAGGISKAADEVKKQAKSVATVFFGLLAVVALIVACYKLVTGLMENDRQGKDINWKPILTAFAATIVCSLFAAATFFNWFGV